ncbi:MAG: EamA family transporter, partial [Gemmatimonadota bacterium]|nr:EamA family transporter [Gemmatimonadota bacterium]
MPRSRVALVMAFAAVYTIWGSTYLAIHYAIATIPPFIMAGGRFLIAGALMYLWTAWRGVKPATRIQWRNASAIGVLLLTVGNGGVAWAERVVPTGIAALIVAIVPLWLVALEWARRGGTRPSRGVALGVAVGLVGMWVLVGPGPSSGSAPINVRGALVLVFASVSWAAGSLIARYADLPSPLLATGIEMLVGGAALMILGFGSGEMSSFAPRAVSTSSLEGLAYLIVFGSLIAFTAYSWLLKNATPAAVGTYAYVNPVVAVFLGWLIAGE